MTETAVTFVCIFSAGILFVEEQNLSFACSCIQIEGWIVYKSFSLPNIGLFAKEKGKNI